MKNNSSISTVLIMVACFGFYILNDMATRDNVTIGTEIHNLLSGQDAKAKKKQKELDAENTQKLVEELTKAPAKSENVKQTRLDPSKAKWETIKQQKFDQMNMEAKCDTNGKNIYVNENGNVMNLFATSKSGIDYDRYGRAMQLDGNEYLVCALEIDVNNNRQRIVDAYKYHVGTGTKSSLGYDTSEFGNWTNLDDVAFPNYYAWIRTNYNKFTRSAK
ncbi:hypothetical protein [Anaerovibrio sp.]|uniref:hypothetical protein n=1 Tax=Anaerovibrio sp. TaxID=1872532 RepID=UPI003890C735